MMKIAIVAVALLGVAMAFPQQKVPVLVRSEIRDDFNQFALAYQTKNGISVAQQGALKLIPGENGVPTPVLVQRGSYAYLGQDGKIYELHYIADENGFQPIADHIPVAPVAEVAPVA